jgi:heme O synthase-like polyprenyltransferase
MNLQKEKHSVDWILLLIIKQWNLPHTYVIGGKL